MSDDFLAIANGFGSVDVRATLSKRYVHVPGKRLQPIWRKLGIKYANALTGFIDKKRFGWKPVLDGVVVSSQSAPKLIAEIENRRQRNTFTPEQLEQRQKARKRQKARRQQKDIEEFASLIRINYPSIPDGEDVEIATRACKIGSGRVGRSKMADDPVRLAVVAHVRHSHTEYDDILDDEMPHATDWEEREEIRHFARESVADKIDAILAEWEQPKEE